MLKVKCIDKIRDNRGVIVDYVIQDTAGKSSLIGPERLKQMIAIGELTVDNLKLTADNRLIGRKQSNTKDIKNENAKIARMKEIDAQINKIIDKAKVTGKQIKQVKAYEGSDITLVQLNDTSSILCIPSNVCLINRVSEENRLIDLDIKYINGQLKVIGGYNLKNASNMFSDLSLEYLDLSAFDTHNVTNMYSMFAWSNIKSINFKNLNTAMVKNMADMFMWCKTEVLDLSTFNTERVTNMESMFQHCGAKFIDLSSFNLKRAVNLVNVFKACKAEIKASDEKILNALWLER